MVSRQRRWQMKMRAAGRCTICGKDSDGKWLCLPHAKARYERREARKEAYT